jgi:hypothetical protein
MSKFTDWLFKRSVGEIGHRARISEQNKIIAKAKKTIKLHKLLIKQTRRNERQNKLADKIKELSK